MSNVAILFPGQGSQFKNMGEDFKIYPEYQVVQSQLFATIPACIDALSGELDINDTIYAQPILLANQIGILEVVKSCFNLGSVVYGGFSLGEYSAYYGAGVYNLEQAIEIIESRSKLMASVKSSYVTKVVLGLTKQRLTAVVSELNNELEHDVLISNHNLNTQLLINFEQADNDVVCSKLKEAGAKRVLDIAISGPFHTKIYAEAAAEFQAFVRQYNLSSASNNFYLNLTGRQYNNEDLAVVMHDHMVSGVAWVSEIEAMIASGIDTFVELGSKSVVSSMVKKIDRSVRVITIESPDDLIKLEDVWNKK